MRRQWVLLFLSEKTKKRTYTQNETKRNVKRKSWMYLSKRKRHSVRDFSLKSLTQEKKRKKKHLSLQVLVKAIHKVYGYLKYFGKWLKCIVICVCSIIHGHLDAFNLFVPRVHWQSFVLRLPSTITPLSLLYYSEVWLFFFLFLN